jgi:hypothetical protein
MHTKEECCQGPESITQLQRWELRISRSPIRTGLSTHDTAAADTSGIAGSVGPSICAVTLEQFWAMRDGTNGTYGTTGNKESATYRFPNPPEGSQPTEPA